MSPCSKWLNWEIGLRRSIMSRFLTPIRETKLRILMCLAVAALVQPHLVWCFEASGQINVEGPVYCCDLPVSSAQSGDHSLWKPCCESCDSCFDVPISLTALKGDASATKVTLKVQGAQYVVPAGLHSELYFYSVMCLQFLPFSPM